MKRVSTLALSAGIALAAHGAAADTAADDVRLSCRREAAPGRVLCELEVELTRGRLAWADALVQRAPDFARALRARVGPRSATGGTSRRLRLPLALAATATGSGEIAVRARWVTCAPTQGGRELCSPSTRTVTALVNVGAAEPSQR
jgi:hypothetical protein